MARYSAEMKASVIQKMMPPNNLSVAQLARGTGITDATAYSGQNERRFRKA